ncbi:MAG: transcription-repair coupling factor [Candidatus Omnitrophica bacterium]|nr:transcription-repair coupling factor [Candidatus Omnitrophota bacterium]
MFRSLKLYLNENADIEAVLKTLGEYGYTRCRKVSIEGDISLIGETLTVYPATFECPVRIDIQDGTIRSIKSIDLFSARSIEDHKGVIILPLSIIRRTGLRKHGIEMGEQPIDSFVDIEPGDIIVHLDYGIGKYLGVQRMRSGGSTKDYFVLEYRDGDKLYIENKDLHKIQRYVSFHRRAPEISSLKGKRWEFSKEQAVKGAAKVAKDLLKLQAKRESALGYSFSPDTDWQKEVEEAFPYKETPDQLKATADVKKDMEKKKPMDRLLCGDVGYGKTEVALRAAFKAVMDGKQVAFLVPTTILAEQHFNTFTKRLNDRPVNISMLNRFRTEAEQERILKGLEGGSVDIVIGTHRLLSDDVAFKDLGLLIIDEEQRFGVRHKDRIKRLRVNVDILTLTATPIPRTLYLALMGGKDISVIETPPLERMPVHAEVIKYNGALIKDAIEKELNRGGQVYYVHNRVDSIDKVAREVAKLVPGARIMVGHGQMSSKALEKTMLKFMRGDVDILVATTIIQSGIDVPNANTMIVDDADKFGLADLYQLKGRIGRFDRQAYAYLVVDELSTLTSDVQERLAAIRKYEALGSGFKIAMRDLEMRGAGNLLGEQQSGFIDQVGFDLYCRLLREEIERMKKASPGYTEEEKTGLI